MINIFDQSLIIILRFQTKKLKEMFWLVLKKYSEKGTVKTCLTCQNMHVYIHFHNKNQTIFQILLLNIRLKCIKHFFCSKKTNSIFYVKRRLLIMVPFVFLYIKFSLKSTLKKFTYGFRNFSCIFVFFVYSTKNTTMSFWIVFIHQNYWLAKL